MCWWDVKPYSINQSMMMVVVVVVLVVVVMMRLALMTLMATKLWHSDIVVVTSDLCDM